MPERQSQHSWLNILGITVVACVVSTLVALLAVHFCLFPRSFKPVKLSSAEEQVLDQKLERLDAMQRSPVFCTGTDNQRKMLQGQHKVWTCNLSVTANQTPTGRSSSANVN